MSELAAHLGILVAVLAAGALWEIASDPTYVGPKPDRTLARDLGYAVVNIVLVTPFAIHVLAWLAPHLPSLSLDVHPALGLVIGFFVFEGVTYGLHRLYHSSPLLMRFHRVHHSVKDLEAHVAFRMHPLDVLASILVGNIPLLILGMPAWGGVYVILAERFYAALLHARAPFHLGVASKVFASGAFHHRHHTAGGASYNFGGVVSLFDYLFGTAAPEVGTEASARAPLAKSLSAP